MEACTVCMFVDYDSRHRAGVVDEPLLSRRIRQRAAVVGVRDGDEGASAFLECETFEVNSAVLSDHVVREVTRGCDSAAC